MCSQYRSWQLQICLKDIYECVDVEQQKAIERQWNWLRKLTWMSNRWLSFGCAYDYQYSGNDTFRRVWWCCIQLLCQSCFLYEWAGTDSCSCTVTMMAMVLLVRRWQLWLSKWNLSSNECNINCRLINMMTFRTALVIVTFEFVIILTHVHVPT